MKKAVFTIVHNEKYLLPLWLKYYRRYFKDSEIYVLDDDTNDGSTDNLGVNCIRHWPMKSRDNKPHPYSFDHGFLLSAVKIFQKELLTTNNMVLFTECDEFVSPHPDTGLTLNQYMENMNQDYVRCTGWYVAQHRSEPPIDLNQPIMDQRKYGYITENTSKVLLSKIPLGYGHGFHNSFGLERSKDLLLIHLHMLDMEICWNRHNDRIQRSICPWDGGAPHNKFKESREAFDNHRYLTGDDNKLPAYLSKIII